MTIDLTKDELRLIAGYLYNRAVGTARRGVDDPGHRAYCDLFDKVYAALVKGNGTRPGEYK